MIPLIGTTLGTLFVFFMKKKLNSKIEMILLGFSGGVMIASSTWSLLLPSIALSGDSKLAFLPTAIGYLCGIALFVFIEIILKSKKRITEKMLSISVTLHNIPEGMAVGVAIAGVYYGNDIITFWGAISLSIGIAIQNIPEGAIISMPLYSNGISKGKSFYCGFMSGVVEPVFAALSIMFVGMIKPVLPYVLAFAAGAMFYVVIEELIPKSHKDDESNLLPTIFFAIGFVIMMILDVLLG